MRFSRFLTVALVAFASVCTSGTVFGQSSATQKFTVSVPTSVSIVAPTEASLIHNQTNDNQSFLPQTWTVKGNSSKGVNVSFKTGSAFATASGDKRDAKLTLELKSKAGKGDWTITTPTDSTDYANSTPKEQASVAATSNGIGRAELDLKVEFVGGEWGLFAAGEYSTVITGTVAAN